MKDNPYILVAEIMDCLREIRVANLKQKDNTIKFYTQKIEDTLRALTAMLWYDNADKGVR